MSCHFCYMQHIFLNCFTRVPEWLRAMGWLNTRNGEVTKIPAWQAEAIGKALGATKLSFSPAQLHLDIFSSPGNCFWQLWNQHCTYGPWLLTFWSLILSALFRPLEQPLTVSSGREFPRVWGLSCDPSPRHRSEHLLASLGLSTLASQWRPPQF